MPYPSLATLPFDPTELDAPVLHSPPLPLASNTSPYAFDSPYLATSQYYEDQASTEGSLFNFNTPLYDTTNEYPPMPASYSNFQQQALMQGINPAFVDFEGRNIVHYEVPLTISPPLVHYTAPQQRHSVTQFPQSDLGTSLSPVPGEGLNADTARPRRTAGSAEGAATARCERLTKKGTETCNRTALYNPDRWGGQALCKKHRDQWECQHAADPVWPFQYRSAAQSITNIFPPVVVPREILNNPDQSLMFHRTQHRQWTERFLRAAEKSYDAPGSMPANDLEDWLVKQQAKLNANTREKQSFSVDSVNDRIGLLFEIALRFHEGGDAIYPIGGDNGGYNENTSLSFVERLRQIEHHLRINKLIVVDVIEGRGVEAFVRDPQGFHGRKTANLKGNLKKKRIEASLQAVDQYDAPPHAETVLHESKPAGRGRKRKRAHLEEEVLEETDTLCFSSELRDPQMG